ncbi:MAG: hypothetical protein M0R77_13515 [Gammaproteobacteria bacterium]|nr:hypothetical protein [Gammaproteobacteria bacterium]
MDIPLSSAQISLALLTAAAPALASAWRAGALLEAVVVSSDPTKSIARLAIQGRELEVRSEAALRVGERLLLTAEPREGHWQLSRREAPPLAPLEQAWRQILPRQQPLAPALRALCDTAKLPALPPPLREALVRLHEYIPPPQRLATPTGLREAVEKSGIFLEARLAAPRAQPLGISATPAPPASAPTSPASAPVPLTSAPQGSGPASPSASVTTTVTAATPAPITTSRAAPSQVPASTPPDVLPGTTTPAPLSPVQPATLGGTGEKAITAVASSTVPMATDLKGSLLRLLNLLRAPGTAHDKTHDDRVGGQALETLRALARHAEGALARIELQQFRALPERADADPAWVLELPFRQGEDVETLTLRIRRDQEQDDAADGVWPWTITLELGDGTCGPLRAVVALRDKAVSTRFFAGRAELAERIATSLDFLDTRLRAAGLDVQTLEAHVGRVVSEEPLPDGLVKERV